MATYVRNSWQARRNMKVKLMVCLIFLQIAALVYQAHRVYHETLRRIELKKHKGEMHQNFKRNPRLEARIARLNQFDTDLQMYVKSHHVFPIPEVTGNFSDAKIGRDNGRHAVHLLLVSLFEHKKNGYFVEFGAYDGLHSLTILLERDYNWTGLLNECNPMAFPLLKAARRKALTSDVCLSKNIYSVVTNVTSVRRIPKFDKFGRQTAPLLTTFEAQTFPLITVLIALELERIDLVVLNSQGSDFGVLRKFDFGIILVRVWVIDLYYFGKHNKFALLKMMKENGYVRVVSRQDYYIFVHETMNIPESPFQQP